MRETDRAAAKQQGDWLCCGLGTQSLRNTRGLGQGVRCQLGTDPHSGQLGFSRGLGLGFLKPRPVRDSGSYTPLPTTCPFPAREQPREASGRSSLLWGAPQSPSSKLCARRANNTGMRAKGACFRLPSPAPAPWAAPARGRGKSCSRSFFRAASGVSGSRRNLGLRRATRGARI